MRAFTPTSEAPFAGHPSLGATFTLYHNGYLGTAQPPRKVVFEEEAGLVPVTIANPDDGHPFLELQLPLDHGFRACLISSIGREFVFNERLA